MRLDPRLTFDRVGVMNKQARRGGLSGRLAGKGNECHSAGKTSQTSRTRTTDVCESPST